MLEFKKNSILIYKESQAIYEWMHPNVSFQGVIKKKKSWFYGLKSISCNSEKVSNFSVLIPHTEKVVSVMQAQHLGIFSFFKKKSLFCNSLIL